IWGPVVKGRAYVRELSALPCFAATAYAHSDYIESAGFLLRQKTAYEIKNINLLNEQLQLKGKVLIAMRDDRSGDDALFQKLLADGLDVLQMSLPGYTDMMAEPQDTI